MTSAIAEMVQNSLLFHKEQKYRLAAWVIMPNHVHFLATPQNLEVRRIAFNQVLFGA